MTDLENKSWHLDRKVTVSLIFALLANAATTIWWASSISAAVATLNVTDTRHEILLNNLSIGRESNASRITSLEANKIAIETKLGRIEDKLDRVIEHQNKQ